MKNVATTRRRVRVLCTMIMEFKINMYVMGGSGAEILRRGLGCGADGAAAGAALAHGHSTCVYMRTCVYKSIPMLV